MFRDDLISMYSSDPAFIAEYHGMQDMTAEKCADHTLEALSDHYIHIFDFGYFSIDKTDEGISKLGGFFIKPEFRNQEGKQRFIHELYSRMPKIFLSSINNKSKALSFLKKLPGAEIVTTTEEYTYFCFRKGN